MAEFERGEFGPEARGLGNLPIDHPGDGPLLAPLARAVNALVEELDDFDAAWELSGK